MVNAVCRKERVVAATVPALVEKLLANTRLLRGTEFVRVEDERGARVCTLVKTRANLCPSCGSIHGRELRLMEATMIGKLHHKAVCRFCQSREGRRELERLQSSVRTQLQEFIDESLEYETALVRGQA